jgi:ABC-type nitrate/sulfonate/bicarbonate transport system permease component
MFAGIATLTVLGVIINYTLELLERRMTRWKEKVVRR